MSEPGSEDVVRGRPSDLASAVPGPAGAWATDVRSVPLAPPTTPGVLAKPRRAIVWPTPIGIVSLAAGIVGGAYNAYQAAMPWIFRNAAWTSSTPTSTYQPFSAIRHWGTWMSVANIAATLLSISLIAGGIGLLMHRGWSRGLVLVWALVKLPVVLATVVVAVLVQREQMTMAMNQPGMPPAAGAFVDGFTMFFAIVMLAWQWALPIFMLLWLARPGVRRDVAAWRAGMR